MGVERERACVHASPCVIAQQIVSRLGTLCPGGCFHYVFKQTVNLPHTQDHKEERKSCSAKEREMDLL